MYIVGVIAYPLKPFGKGLYRATRQVAQQAKSTVYLSDDAIIDINHHRDFISRLIYDARCLTIPMHLAILFHQLHDESTEQRIARQRAQASLIFFSDACGLRKDGLTWGGCWIMTPAGTTDDQQAENIIDFDADTYPAFYEHPSIDKELNIAILEMIISIRGVTAFLLGSKAPNHHLNDPPTHIHIITDNEVAYNRMLKNKGTHPIVPFLLRELSYLQQTHAVVFTYGTIKSEDNWFTDAGSRQWQTKHGPLALSKLRNLQPNRISPAWWDNLQRTLNTTPPTI